MNPFEMVIAIVLIVVVARVIMHRQSQRQPDEAPVDNGETVRLREDIRALKERIQVLERVITDDRKSTDLDREIERLRDR